MKKTKAKYVEYYKKIGKLKQNPTEEEIQSVLSDANKKELNRINEQVEDNKGLIDEADKIEKQWNKLDRQLEEVVYDFNKRKGYNDVTALNPNLLKALIFSESEMGAGADYKRLIDFVPKSNPNAVYQLNLGRVTDANIYNSVVKEYNIKINWKENYKQLGNRFDVMLAAGALIQKKEYSMKVSSPHFNKNLTWYNAVVAYKGVSAEGARKANLVWSLFTQGLHPYTPNKKLF